MKEAHPSEGNDMIAFPKEDIAGEIVLFRGDDNSETLGLILGDAVPDKEHVFIVAPLHIHSQTSVNTSFEFIISPNDVIRGSLDSSYLIRIYNTNPLPESKIVNYVAKLSPSKLDEILKGWLALVGRCYFRAIHQPRQRKAFQSQVSRINYAGRVFDEKEIINLLHSSVDFWLTAGPYTEQFENKLKEFLGVKYCSFCNSGSSANLLAFAALTSPKLGSRRINKGDEVITVAAAFPTTVAPIIQYGAIPVFVDITLPTYNIDCNQLEKALSEKTKAVMIAHTLGNPFDIKTVRAFCHRHQLWLIEDNCDALGSRYFFNDKWQYTGTFGDIATSSFYPPHHITTGEGGAVFTNDATLHNIIISLRDWGRDCWCPPGRDDTCKRRFRWRLGELPEGYDHKYIYSHFGYNLKATDMQAAVGCAQIEKLEHFVEVRKKNWKLLREGLDELSHLFVLPEATPNSDPSWFGFVLTVKENAGFSRDEIVSFLEANNIQTRMLFAGNLIRHPCFDEMRKAKNGYRVVGDPNSYSAADNELSLPVTELVMNNSFWIGVYPGLRDEMIEFVIRQILTFARNKTC